MTCALQAKAAFGQGSGSTARVAGRVVRLGCNAPSGPEAARDIGASAASSMVRVMPATSTRNVPATAGAS